MSHTGTYEPASSYSLEERNQIIDFAYNNLSPEDREQIDILCEDLVDSIKSYKRSKKPIDIHEIGLGHLDSLAALGRNKEIPFSKRNALEVLYNIGRFMQDR